MGSGQLVSQFCHFPEASRHKEENVLSHNKLSGSGESERLRLPTTSEFMLMPGKKSRAGVLGHEGEMRCSLRHLYHWEDFILSPFLALFRGKAREGAAHL